MSKSKGKKSGVKKGVSRTELKAVRQQLKALEAVKKHLDNGSRARRKQSVVWTRALRLLSESETA